MELIIIFFFLKKKVVARSFTADGNLLQPTGSVNRTPHRSHFLVFVRTHDNVTHDIGSSVSASYHPCLMRLCV